MTERKYWLCKLGTVPTIAMVHGADAKRMSIGSWVRIKESEGDKWHRVHLTGYDRDADNYFTADR